MWLVPAKNRTAVQQTMLRKAGRIHAARWGSALAVLLLIGSVIGNVIAAERQRSMRRQVATAVDAVQSNRGTRGSVYLARSGATAERIGPRRDKHAIREMPNDKKSWDWRTRWRDTARSMSRFSSRGSNVRRPKKSTTLSQRSGVRRPQWRPSKTSRKKRRRKRMASQGPPGCRYALDLEDDRIAADMCRIDDRPEPITRTIFIDELPAWHGDVTILATHCSGAIGSALRSASASLLVVLP